MRLRELLAIAIAASALLVPGALAQDTTGNSELVASQTTNTPLPPQDGSGNSGQLPAPAGRAFPSADSPEQDSEQPQPDDHLLSSGESFGLGSLQRLRNVVDPSFRFAEVVNTGVTPGQTDFGTILGATLTFERHWKRSQLAVLYSGGDSFYYPVSIYGQQYHSVTLSDDMELGRWTLHLRDSFMVAPGGGFGGFYTGAVGPIESNGATTPITPELLAQQTILTGPVSSLNNTAMGEVDYGLNRRSAITLTGSYGTIDVLGAGFLDSQSSNLRAGYNYSLSSKNSLGVIYTYGDTTFSGESGVIRTQLAQLSFGRKVTGRLAVQIAAGPELVQLQNFGPSSSQRWTWSMSTSLSYQMTRATGYNVSYFHGTNQGSGVYLGAETDTATGGITHRLTRAWSASGYVGYARNSELVPVAGAANQFDNWYAGVNLSRLIARQLSLGISYGFQRQTSGAGPCPVANCGLASASSQLASVSLAWHPFAVRRE